MGLVKNAVLVMALPAILLVAAVVLALWVLFTVTGVGPILNWLARRRDSTRVLPLADLGTWLMLDCVTEPLLEPPSDVKLFRTPQGYRLAVRYSGWDSRNSSTIEDSPLLLNAASTRRRHFPIAIPNGLAATALATSSMHERLVAAGFEVRVDSSSCCCSSLPLCVCVCVCHRY